VGGVEKEASRARDQCVAKDATFGTVRLDPSLGKERLLGQHKNY